MKFAKTLVAMVLALAMVLTMSSVAMAEDAGTIKIGLIGPMTGAAASYGCLLYTSICGGCKFDSLRQRETSLFGLASLSGGLHPPIAGQRDRMRRRA